MSLLRIGIFSLFIRRIGLWYGELLLTSAWPKSSWIHWGIAQTNSWRYWCFDVSVFLSFMLLSLILLFCSGNCFHLNCSWWITSSIASIGRVQRVWPDSWWLQSVWCCCYFEMLSFSYHHHLYKFRFSILKIASIGRVQRVWAYSWWLQSEWLWYIFMMSSAPLRCSAYLIIIILSSFV